MNGQPATGPITYTFPKVEKVDRVTGHTRQTLTLQAAVAQLAGQNLEGETNLDRIAANLLAGNHSFTELYWYRTERRNGPTK